MKTIINIGFLTLILIILSGCSSGKTENSTDSLIGPSSDQAISQSDENAIRSCSWYPPAYVNGFDFVENGIGNYKATLIDCIADTYYLTSSGDSGNYLLVCDQQGTWDSAPFKARMHVFFIPSDADDLSDVKEAANVQGTTIVDPDACDLIAINDGSSWKLYAFVYDGYDGIISHYAWTIDSSDGDLSNGGWVTTTTIDCGDNAHASGMAITPLDNERKYNVIVCDPQEKKVFKHNYYYDSLDQRWEMDENQLAVLDDVSPDIPIDVAITRYDGSYLRHTAYIAVESSTNRNHDYIYCYHWDGYDYDENAPADWINQPNDYFPYLVSLDVMKVGCESDDDIPHDQHYDGTVVAHMVNVGLFRSYCFRQVNFGDLIDPPDAYYQFIQNYSPVNSSVGEIYPESIAVARYYKKLSPPPSDNHISGQLIFIASRNPDLESGKDVKVYFSQDDT